MKTLDQALTKEGKTTRKNKKEMKMKKLRLIKTITYLVFCAVVAAAAAIVPAGQAEAAVSNYRLVDIPRHGPVYIAKESFYEYFSIGYAKVTTKCGHIVVHSLDEKKQIIATHTFEWEFSRDVSYLFPDPNNNLSVQMAVQSDATNAHEIFMKMKTSGPGYVGEFKEEWLRAGYDTTNMLFTDTWLDPGGRNYANKGWSTHQHHVWEFSYFENANISIDLHVKHGPHSRDYGVVYLYQAQDSNVTEALVTSLALVNWPVGSANCGGTAKLWAQIHNTGNTVLPSDAKVWFYVRGAGVDKYVGGTSVAGINAGHKDWRSFDWKVPYHATGTYTYWALVFSPTLGAISPFSYGQNFTVSCY